MLNILLHWQEEQLLSIVNGYPVQAEWWAIISLKFVKWKNRKQVKTMEVIF